ncbi:MAG: HAD family phosphatase [Microbacteriaceae bacterium]|nr:HAD family phosphatase [Microbacteriaceae bacterium]
MESNSDMNPELPTVVFDIGGVLVQEGNRRETIRDNIAAKAPSLDKDSFIAAYWQGRDAYDRGVSPAEYWRGVLAESGADEAEITDELIAYADKMDGELSAAISEEMTELLHRIHAAGAQMIILSNAPASMANAVRSQKWFELFDGAVFSSEVALIKPEPEIYAAVEKLAKSKEIVFFDDRPVNTEAANARGWNAVTFTQASDVTDTLTFLERN